MAKFFTAQNVGCALCISKHKEKSQWYATPFCNLSLSWTMLKQKVLFKSSKRRTDGNSKKRNNQTNERMNSPFIVHILIQKNKYISKLPRHILNISNENNFRLYNLTIRATNMASVSATSSAIIHVLDCNDNAPYFTQQLYKGEISESAPISSLILAINDTLKIDQR